jgi:GT2 family glycosyltransferase
VVVDNASRDGTATWLAQRYPEVRVITNRENRGFAPATNQGARAARSPGILAFLNNDVQVEPNWLRPLVAPIVRGRAAATVGKMLSADGKRIDHAGGGLNWQGIAISHGYQQQDKEEYAFPRKCLFACGGAMAMDAGVFHELGGFDEEFFAYYEDSDLGWRTWIAGHEVHYVPESVCTHHHSLTSRRFPSETMRLLQVRNPLLTCFKNYDDENLRAILPAVLLLYLRRSWVVARMGDAETFRVEKLEKNRRSLWRLFNDAFRKGRRRFPVGVLAAADLVAANDWLEDFDHWVERRSEVQSSRKRSDAEIFRLFLKPFWSVEKNDHYRGLQRSIEDFLGLDRIFAGKTAPGPEPND